MSPSQSNSASPIEINSRLYKAWHELGHAVACITYEGQVTDIRFIDDPESAGGARTRCTVPPGARKKVACGGFAAELFLYLNHLLVTPGSEKEMANVLYSNAVLDRLKFCGLPDASVMPTHEQDIEFQKLAYSDVLPLIILCRSAIDELAHELTENGVLLGARIREVLRKHAKSS